MITNFLRTLCVIFFAAIIGGGAFANSHLPPLHQAAENGDIAEVKRLIDDGADIHAKTIFGRMPLHYAAQEGQTETALALIKAGADIHAKTKLSGLMPLHVAAQEGQTETALALVKAGADIHAKTEYPGSMALHSAAQEGQTKTALALIKAGAYINAKQDLDGKTPLHVAAGAGQIDTALAIVKAGADINAEDKLGWTPLHIAALRGLTETALALIKAGADIHAKDIDGWAPLHSAAEKGKTETALALIKAGAYIHATTNFGKTPLHVAAGAGQIDTALAIVKAGADINAKQEDGWTPLHIAAENGHAETIIALIHAGAYLKATTNQGYTPLGIARYYKQWGVVAILENPPPPKPSGESAPNVSVAPAPEDSNVAEFVFENAWRSVVFIRTKDGQGSGVIIKPNIVATNCHVIDGGGIEVYKAHNRRTDESKSYSATLRRRDEKNDFCLLDVAGLWGVAANVRRYDTLRIGESVYGIGAPKGLDLSLSSGLVSQKRKADGINYIQTDVAISPGSSGGGLFDRKGNLVGILTSKIVDDDVEGIGFAIPADLAL